MKAPQGILGFHSTNQSSDFRPPDQRRNSSSRAHTSAYSSSRRHTVIFTKTRKIEGGTWSRILGILMTLNPATCRAQMKINPDHYDTAGDSAAATKGKTKSER